MYQLDPKRKFFLFKQAQHFCSVPWNHIEIFTDGTIYTCSKGIPLGTLQKDKLEDILNGDTIKSIKRDLQQDLLTTNCHGCHALSTGKEHFDLRNHYNPIFQSFDVNYDDQNEFKLHGIDLHWDHTCNFKCVYCTPFQSSSIAQEQAVTFNKVNKNEVDKLIDLIIQSQYEMSEIYLSGGEPLLIKHNLLLLSKLSNTDIPIRINSNISHATSNNAIFNELKRFKNVLWTVSADSRADRFNYTRYGGDWNLFLKNLENIKQTGHNIRLNSVFFIGNLLDIFSTIEFFIKTYNITDITINQLEIHRALLPRNATSELKAQSLSEMQKLIDKNLISVGSNSYYNIIRCARELNLPIEDASGYIDYFDNLDRLRNTNWRNIFPELQ